MFGIIDFAMSIYELKILFDLDPKSKSKILNRYAKKFYLGYFFVDSEDGHCYLLDKYGEEKDVSLVYKINENMIPKDIKKIVIPNNVTSIGYGTFYKCYNFINMTIPNSVTSIMAQAFEGCDGLTSVTIPDSVTNIGGDAFSYCNNLKSIIFKGKIIDQVKTMKNYPFGIEDESIIKAELN